MQKEGNLLVSLNRLSSLFFLCVGKEKQYCWHAEVHPMGRAAFVEVLYFVYIKKWSYKVLFSGIFPIFRGNEDSFKMLCFLSIRHNTHASVNMIFIDSAVK
jgi:hypothetical protein